MPEPAVSNRKIHTEKTPYPPDTDKHIVAKFFKIKLARNDFMPWYLILITH